MRARKLPWSSLDAMWNWVLRPCRRVLWSVLALCCLALGNRLRFCCIYYIYPCRCYCVNSGSTELEPSQRNRYWWDFSLQTLLWITSKWSTKRQVLAKSSNSKARLVSTLMVPSLMITGELISVSVWFDIGLRKSLANSVIRLENHSYKVKLVQKWYNVSQ